MNTKSVQHSEDIGNGVTVQYRAAAPRWMSQRTCDAACGLPPRNFLEAAREYAEAGGAVASTGKLRLVEIEPFMRWLSSRRAVAAPKVTPANDVDTLAASLGLVAVGGVR